MNIFRSCEKLLTISSRPLTGTGLMSIIPGSCSSNGTLAKQTFTLFTRTGTRIGLVGLRYSSSSPFSASKSKQKVNYEKPDSDSGGGSGNAIFLSIIPLSALGLGIWQVFRWRWKLGQIAELENQVYAPAVDLPQDLSELNDLEFSRVKVKGKFDYSKAAIIGPRSLYRDGPNTPKEGLIKKVKTDTGYYLVTPFQVSGRDLRILVSRGWIPSRKETDFKEGNNSDEEVEIVGVFRKPEARPQFVSSKSGSPNFYLYRDVPSISQKLSTSDVFLDLNEIKGKDLSKSFPIPGQTRVSLRNEHVQYFITWFSLAGITGYMWHRVFILKKALK